MDVGLAVRDDQHLVALQFLAQDAPQRVRAPDGLRLVARAPLGFQVEHQRLQVARDRAQLGARPISTPGASAAGSRLAAALACPRPSRAS